MKLKMRLSTIVLSLSMATMSFLMAVPQKVSALENEGQSVAASVTTEEQEVSDVKKESDSAKEKAIDAVKMQQVLDSFVKAQREKLRDVYSQSLIFNAAMIFLSSMFNSYFGMTLFSASMLFDLIKLFTVL